MHETMDVLLRLGPEFGIKFLVALLCGGAVGMERETAGKPAGLRTSIVVCVGSTLFTEMSIVIAEGANGDPSRIAAQIVSGVGFLGAGVILHSKGGIKGITTAAMIWLVAALGIVIGAGYVITAMAVTAGIVFAILLLNRVETWVHRRHAHLFHFALRDTAECRRRIMELIHIYQESVHDLEITPGPTAAEVNVSFSFRGDSPERLELIERLYSIDGLRRLEERWDR